ncbi:MAG: translation initiation factor [Dethiosulfovibrio peptidovorans]|nr:MAG: translation initiation factor [Dethiosulfovibrio peptidovorans]
MARGPKREKRSPDQWDDGVVHESHFAEAAEALGFSIAQPDKEAPSVSPSSGRPEIAEILRGQRAGLRIERKGRRGKTVTVVEALVLLPEALAQVARELRKALGCGSSVEDGAVVLQGDNRDRIASWLRARGVHVRG